MTLTMLYRICDSWVKEFTTVSISWPLSSHTKERFGVNVCGLIFDLTCHHRTEKKNHLQSSSSTSSYPPAPLPSAPSCGRSSGRSSGSRQLVALVGAWERLALIPLSMTRLASAPIPSRTAQTRAIRTCSWTHPSTHAHRSTVEYLAHDMPVFSSKHHDVLASEPILRPPQNRGQMASGPDL